MSTTLGASKSVPTIFGMINQFQGLVDIPYVNRLDTTLNSKYNVYGSEPPTSIPQMKYFGIGIKGFYNVDDNILSQPYSPNAGELDLYQPIPFRCVPIDEDLSATERAKYRMRVKINVNDVEYWAYYLKVVEITSSAVQVKKITTDNQEEDYVIDTANLNPVPSKTSTTGVVEGTSGEISVSVSCNCRITGAEVLEAIGVLFEGDTRYAKISEYGIYTGIDKVVSGYDHNDIAFNYTESIYTQLAHKTCTNGDDFSNISTDKTRGVVFENGNVLFV